MYITRSYSGNYCHDLRIYGFLFYISLVAIVDKRANLCYQIFIYKIHRWSPLNAVSRHPVFYSHVRSAALMGQELGSLTIATVCLPILLVIYHL